MHVVIICYTSFIETEMRKVNIMNNNSYQRYNHRKGRWERRISRNRYRNTYITYPQSNGSHRGGRSMAGLVGAIVILLVLGLNVYGYFIWYFR